MLGGEERHRIKWEVYDGGMILCARLSRMNMVGQLQILYQWLGQTLDYKSCQKEIFRKVSRFRDRGVRNEAALDSP